MPWNQLEVDECCRAVSALELSVPASWTRPRSGLVRETIYDLRVIIVRDPTETAPL